MQGRRAPGFRSASDSVLMVGDRQVRMGGATLQNRQKVSPRATVRQGLGSLTEGRGQRERGHTFVMHGRSCMAWEGGAKEATGRAITGPGEGRTGESSATKGRAKARPATRTPRVENGLNRDGGRSGMPHAPKK